MADEPSGARTEEPTPKRLRDARRRGEVAQSRDLTSAASLAGAIAALAIAGSHLAGSLVSVYARAFAGAARPAESAPAGVLWDGVLTGLSAIAPVLAAGVLLPALVSFLQVGALFTTAPVAPKLERIDPAAGLRRVFSLQSFVETLKAVVKLGVVAGIAYALLWDAAGDLARTALAAPHVSAGLAVGLALRVAAVAAAAFAAVAVLDFLYQRWQHRRRLRMTRYEVQREHKETEGDPRHRAERQRVHREILTHNMLQDVRRATVVIVNPEHVAVALVYEKEGEGAPRVVAKGENVLAARIIDIAREAGVPVIRNVPLAHALLRLELGEEIPEELYEAVAEILKFVYRLETGEGA